jgi:endogenous inhibitor of DNA gyrase (YacG/DUF329 family)
MGYAAIASKLNLTKDQVKYYCRTRGLAGVAKAEDDLSSVCRFCGKDIVSLPHKKRRIFCSDKCRLAWWNSHPELVRRNGMHKLVCAECGVTFQSKNPSQKFCSRACYGFSQRKEKENG